MTAALLLAQAKELNNDTVTPGLLGLLIVVALGVALWLLIRSMNTQLRKVDFDQGAESDTADDAPPPGPETQTGPDQPGGSPVA